MTDAIADLTVMVDPSSKRQGRLHLQSFSTLVLGPTGFCCFELSMFPLSTEGGAILGPN